MKKIAVLVGSLRADSLNMKLAKNLEFVSNDDVEFLYVDIASLPLFNEDMEENFPKSAKNVKQIIEAADGVLFVTPEYNRGISGALKNAIDWATRPNGKNSFNGKPAAIAGATMGQLGTAAAQFGLKSTLVYLNMKIMGQPELYVSKAQESFDKTGQAIAPLRERLSRYMSEFVKQL